MKHCRMNGSFGSSIPCREGKWTHRISVCSRRDRVLPLPWLKWSDTTNLSSGHRLTALGNSTMLGTLVGLCCWKAGHSAAAVSGRPRCWAHAYPSIPNTMPTLLMSWVKRLTASHRMGHPSHLLVKLLLRSPFVEHVYGTQTSLFPLPMWETYSCTHSHNVFIINYPVIFLLRIWPSSQAVGDSPWIRM